MLAVKDLMTPRPDTVVPATPLRQVLAKMNRDGCRHLPVVEGSALVGIITDRDLTCRVVAQGIVPEKATAASLIVTNSANVRSVRASSGTLNVTQDGLDDVNAR